MKAILALLLAAVALSHAAPAKAATPIARAANSSKVLLDRPNGVTWVEQKTAAVALHVTLQRGFIAGLHVPTAGRDQVDKAIGDALCGLVGAAAEVATGGLATPVAIAGGVVCGQGIDLVVEHTAYAAFTKAAGMAGGACVMMSFYVPALPVPGIVPTFDETRKQKEHCKPPASTPAPAPVPDGWVPTPSPGAGDSVPTPTVPPPAATYKWRWESQQVFSDAALTTPASLDGLLPGDVVWVRLQARNTGSATWRRAGSNPLVLGTAQPINRTSQFASSAWVSATRPARLQQDSVAPGAVGTFVFPLTMPASTGGGQTREYFNLVAEGLTWLNEDNGFFIAPRAGSYTASFVDQAAYVDAAHTGQADLGHLRPGQRAFVVIHVRNSGTATWTNTGPRVIRLGTDGPRDRHSAFRDASWLGDNRPAALKEASVPPGGVGTFEFSVTAPLGATTADENFRVVAEGVGWLDNPAISLHLNVVPIVGIAATPTGRGYWLAAADGGVFSFGDAQFYGSAGGVTLNKPVVGIAATPSGHGYWLVAADGGVFAYGDAKFYGSAASLHLQQPVVGIAAHPSGKGYWLVAADGGVFTYGEPGVDFFGSAANLHLQKPVVGIAAAPSGRGYWLVAADGGVFAYGDPGAAGFYGSAATLQLQKPIVGMAAPPSGKGYWLVAADGGVFAYGAAGFFGSLGSTPPGVPIVGMASTPGGAGYWLAGGAESVTRFGDAGQPQEVAPAASVTQPPAADVAPAPAPDTLVTVPPATPAPAAALACGSIAQGGALCVVHAFTMTERHLTVVIGSGHAKRTTHVTLNHRRVARLKIRGRARLRGKSVRLLGSKHKVLAQARIW